MLHKVGATNFFITHDIHYINISREIKSFAMQMYTLFFIASDIFLFDIEMNSMNHGASPGPILRSKLREIYQERLNIIGREVHFFNKINHFRKIDDEPAVGYFARVVYYSKCKVQGAKCNNGFNLFL
jgi:hypothetical protein